MNLIYAISPAAILFTIAWNGPRIILCEKEVFSSLAQLESLWHKEIALVKSIEEIIDNLSKPPPALERYLQCHRSNHLSQTLRGDYLAHPVNAFHFIRNLYWGWSDILSSVLKNRAWLRKNIGELIWTNALTGLQRLGNADFDLWPDINDVKGAALAIARLWNQYKFDLEILLKHGKIAVKAGNGSEMQNAKRTTSASVQSMNEYDIITIASVAQENGLHDAAVALYEILVQLIERGQLPKKSNFCYIERYSTNLHKSKKLLRSAKSLHDEILIKNGPISVKHVCNFHPFNGKANLADHNYTQWKANRGEVILAKRSQVLCGGKQIKSKLDRSSLRCTYASSESKWLVLGPMKVEAQSYDPQIIIVKELLQEVECAQVIGMAAHNLKPWTANYGSNLVPWSEIRVMKNCEIDEAKSAALIKLSRRLAHLTRFKTNSSRFESSPLLVGNYGVGGGYAVHMDKNEQSKVEKNRNNPNFQGNAAASILMVLMSPKMGGRTIWPLAGVTTLAGTGDGILWYNLFRNDNLDNTTQHSACGVLYGSKWIGNKWIGYNNQWNTIKCGLSMYNKFQLFG